MRLAILVAALLLATESFLVQPDAVAQTLESSPDSATSWQGMKVLPKLDAVVKMGGETIDGKALVKIPWTVQDVDGELLLVGTSSKGWVHRSQVMTLDEALVYCTEIISKGNNDAWAFNYRAIVWREKGYLELAIADFGEYLRITPDSGAYNNRGTLWDDKKEYDKAIADFSEAIRLDNTFVAAYNNRGSSWLEKKDYDQAIADFNEAIRLDETFTAAYNNRGNAWLAKKESAKAIADYDTALHLDPNYVTGYVSRGNAWLETKEYAKAIADYDSAIRLDPNYVLAYYNRGNAWQHKNRYDKALADFNDAIRLDPKDTLARHVAAWLLATCPDKRYRNGAKAKELATRACELTCWTDAYKVGTLAAAYAETGDFESAVKYQNKALELNPGEADFVEQAKKRLELYEKHKPYRDE